MIDFEFEFDTLTSDPIDEKDDHIEEYKPQVSISLKDLKNIYRKNSFEESERLFIKSFSEELVERKKSSIFIKFCREVDILKKEMFEAISYVAGKETHLL